MDEHQAYDGVGGPKLVHVGRRAYARPRFVDAVKVIGDNVSAVQVVMRMDGLFLVDRDSRQTQLSNNMAENSMRAVVLVGRIGYTWAACRLDRRC